MKKEQVEKLDLGIGLVDAQTTIMVESALQWVNTNTTLAIDFNDDKALSNLGANVKLFIIKYLELMGTNSMIASESLGGMSQSFNNNANKSDLLWQYASELFGNSMGSQLSFVPAKSRWR